jgi:hypothetical protein
MKYETPEVTALMPTISAIQSTMDKSPNNYVDSINKDDPKEALSGFADWE